MFNNESEGLGYIAWWGLTPAIDVTSSLKDEDDAKCKKNTVFEHVDIP